MAQAKEREQVSFLNGFSLYHYSRLVDLFLSFGHVLEESPAVEIQLVRVICVK